MQKENQYANGQVQQSQSGNILTYYFKTGIVKAQGPLKENLMDASGTSTGRTGFSGRWATSRRG